MIATTKYITGWAGAAPAGAAGWNVYAGLSPQRWFSKIASPIAAGQTWEQPERI